MVLRSFVWQVRLDVEFRFFGTSTRPTLRILVILLSTGAVVRPLSVIRLCLDEWSLSYDCTKFVHRPCDFLPFVVVVAVAVGGRWMHTEK